MASEGLQTSLKAFEALIANPKQHQYTVINGKTSLDSSGPQSYHDHTEPDQDNADLNFYRSRQRLRWVTTVLIMLLLATNGMLMAALFMKRPTDRECDRQLSVWSPLQNVVEYDEYDFDNAFAHDTVYRGPPSVKLEEAWEDLWLYDGVRIPEDKLPLLNRSHDLGKGRTLKSFEDSEGGFHAMFEVFHQLHCLNLVRQYTWKDWYLRHPDVVRTPTNFLVDEVTARMHVDHCIETLRVSLMCHADTTPYFIMNDPTAPRGERADFSPHHKCRKFEPLRKWTEENQWFNPRVPDKWKPDSNAR